MRANSTTLGTLCNDRTYYSFCGLGLCKAILEAEVAFRQS